MRQTKNILERIAKQGVVLGDGGYLIELERRGWVDSGSGREKVGTGKGSGQFTPEVAIEHPDALRELHREFLNSGSQVLQALTFFGTLKLTNPILLSRKWKNEGELQTHGELLKNGELSFLSGCRNSF